MASSVRDPLPPARSVSQAALDLALAEPGRALALADRAIALAGATLTGDGLAGSNGRAGSGRVGNGRVGNGRVGNEHRPVRAGADPLATSMALQARGLALRGLERPGESVEALGLAVRVAQRAGHAEQAARARVSLSLSLSQAGRNRAALAALDRAGEVLRGAEADRVEVQRGLVYSWLGQPQHAVGSLAAVLPRLQRSTDRLWEARALSALGIARVELGEFAAADAALARAEELFAALGQHADAAGNRHNRGWCAGLRGDVPLALRHYDEAERRFTALGVPAAEPKLDRARLLMSVGLMGEAATVAEDALRALGERRASGAHAEALLAGAEIALAQGDPDRAREHSERAVRALGRQRRTGRLLIARYTQLRARWQAGERTPGLDRAARRAAGALQAAGLLTFAAEAHLLAGRCALAAGDTAGARSELGHVAAARHRGPALQRSQAWLAEAHLRLIDGDTRAAAAALRAGLRVIDRYRSALGAVELRYRTATHVTELADLGRRLAVGSRRPEQVLRWSDYGRATALRLPPVRPPGDPQLADALTALRRLGTSDGDDTPAKQRQRLRLQQEVQRRTRAVPSGAAPLLPIPPSIPRLSRVLASRALLTYTAVDGILHAVTLVDGRTRLHALGGVPDAQTGAAHLMAALRRCLTPGRPAALRHRAWQALQQAAADLDAELVRPLAALDGADEVVIVSPPWLQLLPWSALPSMSERAVTVAPSVAAWYDAAAVGGPAVGRVALVAGPRLTHAVAEVDELGGAYREPLVLTGPAATVSATCAALDGAAIAHVAAHGHTNLDNPLFSALELADGPLMTYDLERLDRVPALFVLSACDSLNGSACGEELLGMATALLHLGSRAVVGSIAPLPDEAALVLMRRLHARLAAGHGVADALRRARRDGTDDDPLLAAGAHAVACMGAA